MHCSTRTTTTSGCCSAVQQRRWASSRSLPSLHLPAAAPLRTALWAAPPPRQPARLLPLRLQAAPPPRQPARLLPLRLQAALPPRQLAEGPLLAPAMASRPSPT